MQATSRIHFEGHWKEGVGPENQAFLGPEMATSKASAIRAKKVKTHIKAPLPSYFWSRQVPKKAIYVHGYRHSWSLAD